ncbi:membrane protein [Paenibacillus dendritiformis]|uniref:sulfite exporter TauE/SafE family protein n=1 Tax=Paenibacillus dendritiformis TaxID=130049 RepID=UPI001B027283|nr:sulfite exporter TauE/SafE family protein [Paenibacillus dendritiformis]GIO70521.1 membrane protein [Paenibacillus dendritiformis]
MSGEGLWLVAASGLLSAPHCIGMCGGIVMNFALNAKGPALAAVLAYNAGRVVTYTAMGAAMGAAGSFLELTGNWAGLQGLASLLGGLLILLWAFRRVALPLERLSPARIPLVRDWMERLRGSGNLRAVLASGLLFGFIPCGLTYAMQINAAASGSALGGGTIMAVFGLATFPSLLAVGLFAAAIKRSLRARLMKAGQLAAAAIGILCILRGLSANGWIPSLHPWLW